MAFSDIPEILRTIDSLKSSGKSVQAVQYAENAYSQAKAAGKPADALTVLNELLGLYRHCGTAEKAIHASDEAVAAVKTLRPEVISGATVLLNAATTMSAFGSHEAALEVFYEVKEIYTRLLEPGDYRTAGLYNNMAFALEAVGRFSEAEACFFQAESILENIPGTENDRAVTLCSLAEMSNASDPFSEKAGDYIGLAWENLNSPFLPHDGYHAFTIEKCLPCFDSLGYFSYAAALRARMEEIYERS